MSTLPQYGSGTSRKAKSGTQTTSLPKWKIVKNFSTSITVLRRFGVSCRIGTTWVEVQCTSISPKLVTGSTQPQLEKNKLPFENAATDSRIGRHETRKARGVCKELALDPVVFYPILRTFISIQALQDPPGEISITKLVVFIAVTVWSVTQRASKKQIFFLCSFGLMINGVHAEDIRKPNDPDAWETHDYAEAAAMTLLALVLTIGGAGVARRMCNRWRPLPAAAVAPAAPAVPAAPAFPAVPVAPAAPAFPAVPVPAFDVMGGLTRSAAPTRGNTIFDIPPKLM